MQPEINSPARHEDSRVHQALAQVSYFDPRFSRDTVKLLPGEYFLTREDKVLVTVLGACVSACIRDTVSGIGGMNHFLVPAPDDCASNETTRRPHSMLYGTAAMDCLIDQLLSAGARFERLEAKVFGGAQLAGSLVPADTAQRSKDGVLDDLAKRGIAVSAQSLGGVLARKVYFFPYTGSVLVRTLQKLRNDTVPTRDRDYAAFIKPRLK